MKPTTRLAVVLLFAALPAAAKHHPKRPPPTPPTAPQTPPDSAAPAAVPPPQTEAQSPAESAATAPQPPPAAPAAPAAQAPPPPPATDSDLEALRGEYDAIRDELFRSRARIGAVGEAVFKTKLVVELTYKAQRDWPLKRLVAQLDDRQVFAEDNPRADKALKIYDSFAGQGRHVLAVDVQSSGPEARAGFGVTGVFLIDVTDGKQTHVTVVADEVGSGPDKLARKRTGTYDVKLRAEIATEPLPPGAAGPPAK